MKQSNNSEHTGSSEKKGRYHNDYSPRYQSPYDIYEKAREHMKKLRNNESDPASNTNK